MQRKLLRQIASLGVLIALALLLAAAQKPPARVAASLDPSVPTQIRFEGELKSKTPDVWNIGEYNVLLDQQTNVIEKRGFAEPGAWLIVWAANDPSGTLRAEIISVDRPAGQSTPIVQFTDILYKMTNESWVIGEKAVHVGPATAIVGNPRLNCVVSATVEQREWLEAKRLEVVAQDPKEMPVEFEGVIEVMNTEFWQVQGQRFRVTPETDIQGQPAVDKYAEVQAAREADDSLTALRVSIPDRAAERTMGAVIGDISPDQGDTELWDVTVFPGTSGGDPYSALVHVDGNTIMDESQAVAQAGQWADMRTRALGSGEYTAEVIRVEQPIPVTVEVDLQAVGTASGNRPASTAGMWWQVNGRTVWVPSGALAPVSASGEQGKVQIEGVLLGNGVVWAKRLIPAGAGQP